MTEKIKTILKNLTLPEKASLCSGKDFWSTKPIPRLDVPSVFMSDGPHGLRKENDEDDNVGMKSSFPATSFPPAVNLASTWNPQLAYKMGECLADQCKDQSVHVILGPGTNIKRSPLCGRNFEYLSEDPYLAGQFCRSYIDGVQDNGVGTSLKHYCANSQEKLRMTINSVVDERALREIYLPAFEEAIKSKPWTVMCSYNKLNGTYLSDNKRLLTEILREEWGFDGIVVSDWNATNDRVEGIRAGMDLEMPSSGGATDKAIVSAVKNNTLTEEELDIVAERLLAFVFRCKEAEEKGKYTGDYERAHDVAREIAEESMVLLKNERGVLPYTEDDTSLGVIGEFARTPRYQGSGSSRINPYKLVSFLDTLKEKGTKFEFAPGYEFIGNNTQPGMIAQALDVAKRHKKLVLFVGLTDDYESESLDRSHLSLPDAHIRLIEEVCAANPDTVVVLSGGSPVEMPWVGKADTLLNAYLPGEAGGEALYNVLFGKVNPGGKLAETYPLSLGDFLGSQYYPMGPKNVEYRESIFVGYRYYDSARKDVLFPFGYGLSYTRFAYSDLETDGETVSFTVANVGERDGAEICQVYVRDKAPAVFKADKELKAFDKIFVKAGESRRVSLKLDYRSYAFYNTAISDWCAMDGVYEILVGSSSRDIRLSAEVEMRFHRDCALPDYSACPCYFQMDRIDAVPSEQFEALCGSPIPANVPSKRGEFDRNSTIDELTCCLIGKIIMVAAPPIIKTQVPNADMTTMLILKQGMREMPMRALHGVTSGLLSDTFIDGMILWGNRKRFKGFCYMFVGFFKSLGNILRKDEEHKRQKEELKRRREEEKRLEEEQKRAEKEEKAAAKILAKEEKAAAKEEKATAKQQAKEEKGKKD